MRPIRVNIKNLKKYNRLHSKKIKFYSGNSITALYQIKETDQFYISISSWSSNCSTFKKLKYKTKLNVDIPIITDTDTIKFLNDHAWHDWVNKELNKEQSDMSESILLLTKLFPNKKYVFFYELTSIIHSFGWGNFRAYDNDGLYDNDGNINNNGNIKEPDYHDIKKRRYYTKKYTHVDLPKNVRAACERWLEIPDDRRYQEKRNEALTYYIDLERKYIAENFDLTNTFISIGENSVICPHIYSRSMVKGSTYEHAGEINMVITNDTVYFESTHHF